MGCFGEEVGWGSCSGGRVGVRRWRNTGIMAPEIALLIDLLCGRGWVELVYQNALGPTQKTGQLQLVQK